MRIISFHIPNLCVSKLQNFFGPHLYRHHVIMQRRVHQSSSSFRVTSLYTQLRRRPTPSANLSIPPQVPFLSLNEVKY